MAGAPSSSQYSGDCSVVGTGRVPFAISRSHAVTSADLVASRRSVASFAATVGLDAGAASSESESESSDITASLSRTSEAISG